MPTGVQRRRKTRCERSTLDTPPRRTKKPSRKLRLLDGNEARNDGRNGEKRSNRGSLLSAQGGTRTRTPCGATPSRWCVYQFHHLGLGCILLSRPTSVNAKSARLHQRSRRPVLS